MDFFVFIKLEFVVLHGCVISFHYILGSFQPLFLPILFLLFFSLLFLDLDVFPSSDWGSFQRLFLLIIFLSCSFSYPFGTPIMKMLFCLMLSPGPLKVALFLALLPWLGELLWSVSQSFDSLTPAVEPLWCVCQLRNMTVCFFFSLYFSSSFF